MAIFLIPAQAPAALPTLTQLIEQTSPPVVNISATRVVQQQEQMRRFFRGPQGPQGGPFDDFFDQFERFFGDRPQQERTQRSLGSGFIITTDGFIVTNNHVVQAAEEIVVNLQDGGSYEAEIVGRDPETDLALIKIEADQDLPVLEFADSDASKVGDWVVAIGNPFGLDHTVTAGIISAKGRIIGAGPFDNFIQTDASINPGNSGGPLIDMNGNVVGINTAIVATGQGIGFAIPSNMAKSVIQQLKEEGQVTRGWLGVTIQDVDENTAKALGLDEPKGALVASVVPNEPADKAGLRSGDVIVRVEGEEIDNAQDLLRTIAGKAPGEKVGVTVFRQGDIEKFSVELGTRDTQRMAQGPGQRGPQQEGAVESIGLSLKPVNEQEAQALGLESAQGLLVTQIASGSPAAEVGMRQGDVVLQANQKEVNSVADFTTILESEGREKGVLLMLVQRRGRSLFVTVPVPE
jgi:serine protease Do